ncbi:MAG: serine--tRNA ligase [Solirubrobacteraceae bacterium]
MLDPKLIREQPELVREALARRGSGVEAGVDRVLELDAQRRTLLPELEALRAQKNAASDAIAAAKRAGNDVAEEVAKLRGAGAREKQLAIDLGVVEEQLRAQHAALPNLPLADAAPADEVVRCVGEDRRLLEGRDHLALAGSMIDMEAGARLSGSRFAYLRGELVMLELALVRWSLERLRSHGFEPVIPPVLVREQALFGTGFLPDTEQQIYRLSGDELYLVGTSEVALASLHAGEILEATQLPLRYAGFSPCFRREAGAAGRDTRGIFRVHQFDKVEMFAFVEEPAAAVAEHERILAIEEELLGELGIPYRVVNIGVDDLGASAAKKYDLEAWLPGQGAYRELTSCSNTTDYQARRLEIRVRPPGGGKPAPLCTLNGTAVAVGRTIIALLENGQRPDGSVELPACLVEFGAASLIGAAESN